MSASIWVVEIPPTPDVPKQWPKHAMLRYKSGRIDSAPVLHDSARHWTGKALRRVHVVRIVLTAEQTHGLVSVEYHPPGYAYHEVVHAMPELRRSPSDSLVLEWAPRYFGRYVFDVVSDAFLYRIEADQR